jgi:DNA-binding NtrC family response regulator
MRRKSILVVDDHQELSIEIVKLLQAEGYSANCVFDGKTALKELKKNGYGLILLDFKLPDMTAHEVMKSIMRARKRPKVIILTGHGTVESAVELIKMGAIHYYEKPFKPETLLTLIRDQIGGPHSEDHEEKICRLISARLRLARQAKNLTIKDLSHKTNLSVSLLSQIETGKISPSLSTLIRISSHLSLPLPQLFDEHSKVA